MSSQFCGKLFNLLVSSFTSVYLKGNFKENGSVQDLLLTVGCADWRNSELDDQGHVVSFPALARGFLFHQYVPDRLRDPPSLSFSWYRGYFPRLKRAEREANYSLSMNAEINLLKPNDIYIYIYICRTAALTSRRYILNIYSTNIHTEYFKHAA